MAQRVLQSGFGRGVLWTVSGNGIGHLLIVLSAPALSRLYTPADFGGYGAFVALLMLVVSVAGLRYESAVPVPVDDSSAARIVLVALGFVGVTATVAALCIVWVGWAAPGVSPLVTALLFGLGVAGIGTFQVLAVWTARAKAYRLLSTTKIARNGTQAALQIGLGVAGLGAVGLVVGHAAGGLVGMAPLARSLIERMRLAPTRWADLWDTAVAFRRFPAFAAPAGLLSSVGNQAPLLIVIAAYGADVGGGFAFAYRVVAAPVAVVGFAVAQVFVGEFGALVREGSWSAVAMYRRTIVRLTLVGVVPTVALAAFAPSAFAWVFGPTWIEAGHFVRLLTPMLLAQFAILPISAVLTIMERTRAQLAMEIVRVCLGVGAMVVAIALGGGAPVAVSTYSLAMVVAYVIHASVGYIVLRSVKRRDEPKHA